MEPRRTLRSTLPLVLSLGLLPACTGGASPGRPGSPAAGATSPVAANGGSLQVVRAPFRLPRPVEREVAVPAKGRIYLAGGLDRSGASVDDVLSVDPAAGRVVALGSLPERTHDAAAAVIGSKLFVFGGGTSRSTDAVQSFDLSSRRSAIAGRLPTPLSDLAAATVGGTIYLVGGYDGRAPQTAVYATIDGRRFRRAGTLPEGLRYPAVAAAGPDVLIVGGLSSNGPTRDVLVFHPSTGSVARVGRLPAGVAHATAFVLGGVVYVAGGQDASGRPTRTVFEIDLSVKRPVRRLHRSLPGPLSDAPAVELAGKAYVLGGANGGPLSQVLVVSDST